MGGGKQDSGGGSTTVVNQSSSTTPNPPSAEETALQKLELERRSAIQPQLLQSDQNLFHLLEPLSRGQAPGGMFAGVGQGISSDTMNRIIQDSLTATTPSFEKSGLLDSGVRASLQSRMVGDIMTQSELYKQREVYNLLSFIVGAPGIAQEPIINEAGTLSNSLSALRGTTTTSSGSSTQTMSGGSSRRGLFSIF